MHRYLPILILLFGVTAPTAFVAAQEDAADEPETATAADTAPDESKPDDIDPELDSELESENYADAEEKDFIPTEDIPADQAIPFPTDI